MEFDAKRVPTRIPNLCLKFSKINAKTGTQQKHMKIMNSTAFMMCENMRIYCNKNVVEGFAG